MAQPLIKFFRVDKLTDLQATQKVQGGLYFETSTGVLYVYNGTDFEAYSGLKSASFADQKLVLTPSVGTALEIDLSGYVDSNEFNAELAKYVNREQTIAGIDLKDNITVDELRTALGLTDKNLGGEANVLEGVKVNGDKLAIDSEKNVDILIAEGSTNGTISVNGKSVAVHGLGSAAYTEASAYDESGAADAVKTALINGETDFADFKAVGDELRALDAAKVADVTVGGVSVVNTDTHVAALGTAAGKSEEYFVKSEGYVAYSEAEKTKLAGLEAGAEVNIIETVKVNGVALTPDADRAVDVIIPDAAVKGVVANDPVIALDEATGLLSSSVLLSYKSKSEEGGDGIIKLTGKDGANLGQIDASEFIKDGMIDTVAWSTETGKENYLVITWNTDAGKQITEINFGKYVDTWTHRDAAKGIAVENDKYVGVVDTASEDFLTVGDAGFKLSGVQDAIDAAKNAAIAEIAPAIAALDAEVTSTDGAKVTVKVTEVDGKITAVNVTESDIASAQALADLAEVVEDNELVVSEAINDLNVRIEEVAAQIPTELGVMSVAKGTDGKFVTTTVDNTDAANPKVSVEVAYVDGTTAGDKLTTNTYVDEHIAAAVTELVTAEGDSLVSASAAGNKVTVAATQDLTTAVANANSAVQSVASAGGTLQVSSTDNAVNVELAWAQF